MKLYEEVDLIEQAINDLLYPEDESAVIDIESLSNLLNAKTATIERGLESLCKIRARKQAAITACKDEISRLQERVARESKSLQRLESYMLSFVQRSGQKKLECGTFTVGTRESTSVYCAPDFNVEKFMRVKTISEPDKTAIKEALQNGEKIDGAELLHKLNLSVK